MTALTTLTASLGDRVAAGASVITADGDDRPDVVVVDPELGVFAIEIDAESTNPSDREPFKRLNRKVGELVQTTPELQASAICKIVFFAAVDSPLLDSTGASSSSTKTVSLHDLRTDSWRAALGQPTENVTNKPAPSVMTQVAAALKPAFIFESRPRRGAHDEGARGRAEQRFLLDAQQEHVARQAIDDVAILTGPPGSGKTLVLAARARWLATQHPDWRIQILCYNNALVRYLRSLVDGHPNVHVKAVYRWLDGRGARIAEMGNRAGQDLEKAKRWGISIDNHALLIDEVQDFTPEWLDYALATLQPSKGGALLAGDPAQSLYRDTDVLKSLRDRRVQYLTLTRPYRCTKQILHVTSALDPSFDVPADDALDGEPVDLIWAQSWDDQAAAIAWEVKQMLAKKERFASEIGILVTQRSSTIKRLTQALDTAQVPYQEVDKPGAVQFDPAFPRVKVMTVHAAKGHEFSVIFLFGLEALPEPDNIAKGGIKRGRVGFVGMTRARDQLLITYSKDNIYLRKLKDVEDHLNQWTWPDDYILEES